MLPVDRYYKYSRLSEAKFHFLVHLVTLINMLERTRSQRNGPCFTPLPHPVRSVSAELGGVVKLDKL